MRRRWLLGMVVSGALHMALAWWMPRLAPPAESPVPVTVELSLFERDVAADPTAAAAAAATSMAPDLLAPKRSQPEPRRVERMPKGQAVASKATEASEVAVSSVSPASLAPSASLTPSAVAQSWLADGRKDCHEPVPANRCASLSEAGPSQSAAGQLEIASPSDLPLHRRVDGSYEYESDAFTAVIEPDGRVRFKDRLGEGTVAPTFEQTPTGDTRIGLVFTLNLDLDDFVEKVILDRTLYPHAKARFIEQTRALRSELSARYYGQGAARAHVTLHRELMRVLRDDALGPPDKRLAIFTLWDDCADDEQGTQAQHAVERFIREHMPKGSALGYSDDELLALNARRAGARPFAPYAAN